MAYIQLWGGPVCCRAAGISGISMDETENEQPGKRRRGGIAGRVAGRICPPVFADYGISGK